jgi:hypothetical protein
LRSGEKARLKTCEMTGSEFDSRRRITMAEALATLPGPMGERDNPVFRHGTLLVEVYAPIGTDPQGCAASPSSPTELPWAASRQARGARDSGRLTA